MMTPENLHTALLQHPVLGEIRVEANQRGITRLIFSQRVSLSRDVPAGRIVSSSDRLAKVAEEILAFLAGTPVQFSLAPDWDAFTGFRLRVLQATWHIPFGEVLSYGQLACQLTSPGAARAVGAALGSNPIPLIIPCHRVIGTDGSLHGYSAPGGLATKSWLLALEGHSLRPGDPPCLEKDKNGNFC